MEVIFEFIVDLLVDGGIEVAGNKKVSKWIRYPILGLIGIIFAIVIFGIIIFGISLIGKEPLAGLFLIVIGFILLIASILKLQRIIVEKGNQN